MLLWWLFAQLLLPQRVLAATPSTGFLYVEEFRGVPKWHLLPTLWRETTLQVTCGGVKDFGVYVARSKDALVTKFANHDRAWCGFLWQTLSNHTRPASCTVHISPFGTTYVAIGKPRHAIWPTNGT